MEELSGGFPGWDEGCQGTPTPGPSLTSPTALERMWTIFSCGVATTLCPLISMMRCPTRTPPLSAIPPRMRLQICQSQRPNLVRGQVTHPRGHCLLGNPLGQETVFSRIFHPHALISEKLPWSGSGRLHLCFYKQVDCGPPDGPLMFTQSAQGTQHISGFHGPVNSDYFSSRLSFGKKNCLGLSQSCQCFQTVSLCHAGWCYLGLKH